MKFRYPLLALAILGTGILAVGAQTPGINSNLQTVFNIVYDAGGQKPTYSASIAGIAPAAAATDFCTLAGSATRLVRLRRIIIAGNLTAAQSDPVAVLKRSTISTGGTQALIPMTPYDSVYTPTGSASNSATALAEVFTANPTQGTLVGVLADIPTFFGNLTTTQGLGQTFTFGQGGSPVILHSAAQQVVVSFSGAFTDASAKMSCTFEWTEENP